MRFGDAIAERKVVAIERVGRSYVFVCKGLHGSVGKTVKFPSGARVP